MASLRDIFLFMLLHIALSEIYLPCEEGEFVQQEGCSCWNPQAPIIICKNLGLTSIPQITKAHILSLEGNNLTSLPRGAFRGITGLQKLILSNNKIGSIHNAAFADVNKTLEWLDLSGNELTVIPSIFNTVNQNTPHELTHLDMSKNFIYRLKGGAFRGTKQLQTLVLESNAIRQFSPNSLRGPTNLTKLTLSPVGMDLQRIPTKHLQKLTFLSLSNGRPQKFNYLKSWFDSFPALQHLRMTRMGLSEDYITADSFPEIWKTQLKSLILNDNMLKSAPKTLLNFPELENLDLSANMIGDISRYVRFPIQLKYLNLSNNQITRLGSQALLRLKQAESIDISNNKIPGLTWYITQIDRSLNPNLVMQIGGNPWYCTCGYPWFKILMRRQEQTRNGHLTMEEINNSIHCHRFRGFPTNVDGQLMRDVPFEVFRCENGERDRLFLGFIS